MNEFMKNILSCLIIVFSLSSSANCFNWEDDLIANQKSQVKGNRFPVVKYHVWTNHEIGGDLEERTTIDSPRAVFIVVPGAFLPTSTYHIKQFVDAYADEAHSLNKNNIPTYIVVGDKRYIVAAWANELGVKPGLLRFVPDHNFSLMSQLGVLDNGSAGGLAGITSIFYVEEGQIIKLKSEQSYGDVIETSPQEVEKFVSKHWSSGLSSPRQEVRVDDGENTDTTGDIFENLVNGQKPLFKGNDFPVIQYKAWVNNDKLEEKTTADSSKAVFIVVPGAFLPMSTYHIKQFVDAYADTENPLRKNNIPTYVVSGENPSTLEEWAKQMSVTNGLLSFIPDPSYALIFQLGVLEKDQNYGLMGKTSIFYVEDGKILKQKLEKSYGDVIETSPQRVAKFIEKHWLKSSLSSLRQEEYVPVAQVEPPVKLEEFVKNAEPASSDVMVPPMEKRIVYVGWSNGNCDVTNYDKAAREFNKLARVKDVLLKEYDIELSLFKYSSPYRDGNKPKKDLVLFQLLPEEAEHQGIDTWKCSINPSHTRAVGPNWAYILCLKPRQATHLSKTLFEPQNICNFHPIFIDLEVKDRWGEMEANKAEAEKAAAIIAGYVERLSKE